MTIQLIKETPKWKLEWEGGGKVLIKTIRGYIKGEEVVELFNTGYEEVRKNMGNKWMSDNTNLIVYKPEDIEWINTVWLPKMLNIGWKHWAVLEPKLATGNISMRSFIGYYQERGINLKIFHDYDEALNWISSL